MKKIISISVLILAMFVTYSNELMVQAQAPQLPSSATTGDVEVTVKYLNGDPGVNIYVEIYDSCFNVLASGYTNSSGYIKFYDIAVGIYTLYVGVPAGYEPISPRFGVEAYGNSEIIVALIPK